MTPWHLGQKFSTKDQDNEEFYLHCADYFKGGWWHGGGQCHQANLNGLYVETSYANGIIWYSWGGYEHSLNFDEMKIRPSQP